MNANKELSIRSMTVNQIYSLFIEGRLIVNRKYQRKLCWSIEEKRNFIDTVMKGYPVPLFLLALDKKGNYEIIDGMQRLDALCMLIDQKYELKSGYFDLESMPDTLELKRSGKLCQKERTIDANVCKKIANYPLSVSIFSAEYEVEEVFKRINSTGKHLSSQELRQVGISSDYAELIRHLSSEIRGDSSEDILRLNEMSNISLSNYRLGYAINIKNIFWVKNGIINSNDLRQSRDEEIVGFILASMLMEEKDDLCFNGIMLNKLYGYLRNPLSVEIPIEVTQIQNAIDRKGKDAIKKEFQIVMSCIKDVLSCSDITFRQIINARSNISDISLQFLTIYMAMYRLLIKERKRNYNESLICRKLLHNCESLNRSKIKSVRKMKIQADMVYGLIAEAFTMGDIEDPVNDDWSMECVNILNKSRTEQSLYDFKIGFIEYKGTSINKGNIEKVLKTLTAINNTAPNRVGYVIVGVADNEDTAKKYKDFYKIDYRMEGDFPVVGIEHEANAVGLSIDRYTHKIKDCIKTSDKVPQEYIDHLLSNMKAPLLYGKQLIIFKTNYDEIVDYDKKIYIREHSDTCEIGKDKYNDLYRKYYSDNRNNKREV